MSTTRGGLLGPPVPKRVELTSRPTVGMRPGDGDDHRDDRGPRRRQLRLRVLAARICALSLRPETSGSGSGTDNQRWCAGGHRMASDFLIWTTLNMIIGDTRMKIITASAPARPGCWLDTEPSRKHWPGCRSCGRSLPITLTMSKVFSDAMATVDDDHHERRPNRRDRDAPEQPHAGGAVDLGRLDDVVRERP